MPAITVDQLDLERLLQAAGVRDATIWRVMSGIDSALADAAAEAASVAAEPEVELDDLRAELDGIDIGAEADAQPRPAPPPQVTP